MTSYAAYIDESGNHDLFTEKSGASKYFLVLAVLVPENIGCALQTSVEILRAKYFGTGEIKSSNVKEDRRIQIINDLSDLNFQFYAVAVDKARVNKDSGLGFKRSFIKFTNGKLYSALFQNLIDVTVFADAHGSPEFSQSFVKYINDNHARDLFSNNSIQMINSKDNVLVQLADFLVGTLAKLYEDKASPKLREKILRFMSAKRLRVDEWPPHFEARSMQTATSSETDATVRQISVNAAARFLEQHAENTDLEVRAQHAALSFMLFRVKFGVDDDEYISAQAIIEHLTNLGFEDINKYYLRSNIVAKLRDKDVVIASTARGYKIPTSYADVFGFAELVDGIASPLLSRLKRAHGIFDLGSLGKIKILDEPRFRKLQLMLSSMEKSSIR